MAAHSERLKAVFCALGAATIKAIRFTQTPLLAMLGTNEGFS